MKFSCSSWSRLCFRASDCHPRICARNSSDSPGAAALPSTVARLRTSLTFSTKLSTNWCMLTLLTSAPVIPFAFDLCVQYIPSSAPGSAADVIGALHTSHTPFARWQSVHHPRWNCVGMFQPVALGTTHTEYPLLVGSSLPVGAVRLGCLQAYS